MPASRLGKCTSSAAAAFWKLWGDLTGGASRAAGSTSCVLGATAVTVAGARCGGVGLAVGSSVVRGSPQVAQHTALGDYGIQSQVVRLCRHSGYYLRVEGDADTRGV